MTEPTEPVNYTPYEPTSPSYGDIPPIPPPPPPNTRRPWWHIGVPVLMVVALVTLILVPNVVLSKQTTLTSHLHPGVTATAHTLVTASVPIPTPTIAPTSTPTKNPNYTAMDIVQAFQAAGLPTDNVKYTYNIKDDWSYITALSSASFNDPTICGGAICGEDVVFLNVYPTLADAVVAAQRFALWQQHPQYPMSDRPYQAGRCFMDGELLTSVYVQIVKADCI